MAKVKQMMLYPVIILLSAGGSRIATSVHGAGQPAEVQRFQLAEKQRIMLWISGSGIPAGDFLPQNPESSRKVGYN